MTGLEIALLIILIALVLFVLYYYFRGTGGHVAITRPMESRVDEYLDRHFEQMVAEWSLMDRYQVRSFSTNKEKALAAGEEKTAALRTFEEEMNTNLAGLEDRINVLEKQICGE